MNTFILLAAMSLGAEHQLEDFHYYNESAQSAGLPLVNKIYVDLPNKDDKGNFLVFASSNLKHMIGFKEIKSDGLNGLILTFKETRDVVPALNTCTDYPAYPIVLFDGIECTHTNEIVVSVQPSVNKENFLKRLQKVANGTFRVDEIKPKTYLVQIDSLRNPSNALILANLIAKDSFWVRHARVSWIPLNGYVKATASVETPAASSLGQRRNFKIEINVMDPEIKVKTDLLPQMGQAVMPLPFSGENWLDVFPVEIQEINFERSKKIIVTYPFRYLQFGFFYFQPVTISYERNGQLRTVKTENYRYASSSLINGAIGSEIVDIQEMPNDKIELGVVEPVEVPQLSNATKQTYQKFKIAGGATCFGLGSLFLVGALLSFKRKLSGWLAKTDESEAWSELRQSMHDNKDLGKGNYLMISKKLNVVMNEAFGVSLYSVNLKDCNRNFRDLVNELNKIYEEEATAVLDGVALRKFIRTFCKERNYL